MMESKSVKNFVLYDALVRATWADGKNLSTTLTPLHSSDVGIATKVRFKNSELDFICHKFLGYGPSNLAEKMKWLQNFIRFFIKVYLSTEMFRNEAFSKNMGF